MIEFSIAVLLGWVLCSVVLYKGNMAPSFIQFWIAWLKWACKGPFKYGDPSLGSGEIRRLNIKLLCKKYYENEPKWEDFK